jgi:acetoacetate decarboxylase
LSPDAKSLKGRLTLDRLGYSMPADAPAYQAPPYHYRGAQAIGIKCETDSDAALEVLPAPLELAEPATANLSFYWYPFSTFGPYHETILRLYARHDGKPLTYVQQIFVDTEPPMLAGREIWGFPKKLAKIGFAREADMIVGTLERPAGVRLATMIVRPEQPLSNLPSSGPTTGLRIIPSAEAGGPPTAELIAADTEHEIHEAWEGTGSISFPDRSALDPVNRLPVKKVLKATYMEYDILLPGGRVFARL